MRTYTDADPEGYWGLDTGDWEKFASWCDENGFRLELAGISEAGEFYYQRYKC